MDRITYPKRLDISANPATQILLRNTMRGVKMKKIELTQSKFALVDDEDFEWLNQWKWCLRGWRGAFYAGRNDYQGKKSHILGMHRQIMHPLVSEEVDHINNNGLDNQKANLRLCTHSQNLKNQRMGKNNKCGYKGVHWHKKNKKWRAVIYSDGKRIDCGCYSSITEAAQAYNLAALKYHGEFARLNNE